jgi:DNA-binding MarR family transcriptional regulator
MGKLQQELKQKRPFGSARQEAYLAIQRTADLVARPVERLFARYGLTPEQYNVLRILRGSEPEGLPTLEIGYRMISRASNVTRIIDRLEAKNLAQRKRDADDRRVVQIRITAQGQKVLKEMQPHVVKTVEDALRGLNQQEAEKLCALLEKARAGLDLPKRG